jgi:hypothetical protein
MSNPSAYYLELLKNVLNEKRKDHPEGMGGLICLRREDYRTTNTFASGPQIVFLV